jgi:hypothetical protein
VTSLKLDENLGREAATQLRRAGHDVATAVDQGLASATDARLISVCRAEARCLVTLDLDFANPLRFNPAASPGIAVPRLSGRPVRDALREAVDTLIRGLGRMSIDGKLWIVHGSRIRIFAAPDPNH